MEKGKTRNTFFKGNIKAFTLVELIIVIAILAILGTISFLSFGNSIKNTRDSNRATTLANISNGLGIYEVQSGNFPLPENIYSSGKLNNDTIVFIGEVGNQISRILKISTTPKDPLTNSNYIYSTTADAKLYQLASIVENQQDLSLNLVDKTYADGNLKGKVTGNYKNYLKYQSGSEVYVYNIPSLIISNTGITNLLSTGTYFVVNNKDNLPYNIKGGKSDDIKKIDGNQIIKELTKDNSTTLTGINITNLNASNFDQYFTGIVLKSFNISGRDLNTQSGLKDLQDTLKVQITGTQSQTIQNVTQSCNNTTNSGYTIPSLNHNESKSVNKIISNGTGSLTVSCNNGSLIYGNESVECNTNYVFDNNSKTCVQDLCTGNAPDHSQINGTQKYGVSWNHNSTAGICTFVCTAGYYWNGSSCVGASAGYYVSTSGQLGQTACSTGTYQDAVAQNICKSCTNKPSNSTYTTNTALTSNSCSFSCDSGYYLNGGNCISYVNGSCTGLPSNAVYFNNTTSYSLTNANNGTSLTANYNAAPTTNTCEYKCNTSSYWNGSSCVTYVNGSCTGLPSNAVYFNNTTSYTLSNANNGTSLTASYNATPTTNTCEYKCNTSSYWNGSSCVTYVNGSCTGIPSNAVYFNNTASYSLTNANNGTSLTASYNATPTTNTCQFKCNSGYTYNSGNNTCIPTTQNASCSGSIPSNATATTSTTYSQTWNGSAYSPTYSWTNGAGTCGYSCNSGYVWSGSSCNANYLSSYNCGSPGAMRTGDTYTCNFNGIVNVSTFKANFGCNDGETGNYTITFSDGSTFNFNGGCGTVVNIGNKSSSYVKLYMNSGGGGDNQISLETRGVNL